MKRHIPLESIAIVLASCGLILWSLAFIRSSSFLAIDGRRYFSLFDDAMVSMRYAWNFSHGNGLVWNVGDRVQGYTSLLMTLIMSLAARAFAKTSAVLSVQLLGIALILLVGYLMTKIGNLVFQAADQKVHTYLRIVAFICGLAYYPLNYWSLMGMETGLLTVLLMSGLLTAFGFTRSRRPSALWPSGLLFGLAFLTRQDSAVYFVLTLVYLVWTVIGQDSRIRFQHLLLFVTPFVIVGGLTLVFQRSYYGQMLPNTYTLKLTGMALFPRVRNGIGFVALFLKETALILVVATAGLIIHFQREKLILLAIIVTAIAYQIYIGGDAWWYWRFLAPVIPLALILDIDALHAATLRVLDKVGSPRVVSQPHGASSNVVAATAVAACLSAALVTANGRFFPQILFREEPYQTRENQEHVDTAVALEELLGAKATIAVFWAGTLPYYADFQAIDMLGKSDSYIARRPPDMSGSVSWSGMSSVPGHNKYDLSYSLVSLEPTFAEGFAYGNQDMSEWAATRYTVVQYKGITLRLLRGSSDVAWQNLIPH